MYGFSSEKCKNKARGKDGCEGNAMDRLFLFVMMGVCMCRAVNGAVATAESTECQAIFANYV